jgi:DNA-binding NarL/FixJ family response regulator
VTAREAEVAILISAGLRDREIASELGISLRTVKARKSRAGRRLGYNGKRLDVFLVRTVCGSVSSAARLAQFPPRLRRTAELASKGMTNPEIAEAIRISPDSVRNYMRDIFDHAGVWNRRELARFMLGHDVVDSTMPLQSAGSNLPAPSCSPLQW